MPFLLFTGPYLHIRLIAKVSQRCIEYRSLTKNMRRKIQKDKKDKIKTKETKKTKKEKKDKKRQKEKKREKKK